jgi:transcription initiation factor TFIID TATA-box-binding protein
MVCTGAKSEEQARKAVEQVVKRLRERKIPIKHDAEVEIQNIVASASLGGKVHLEEAARTLPKSMYEPEQFPGLIHRMADPKTVGSWSAPAPRKRAKSTERSTTFTSRWKKRI